MSLPFAVKSIFLQDISSTTFNFIDDLKIASDISDVHTTQINLEVYWVQDDRFSRLLSWLFTKCTSLSKISLSIANASRQQHYPLSIDKTGLKSIQLHQWNYSHTWVNEILEKSLDTLESVELQKCGDVSLRSITNSKVIKSIKIMRQESQKEFVKENERIIKTFTNLECAEGCYETSLIIEKNQSAFLKLKRLTIHLNSQKINFSWLYQPTPFSLSFISIDGLDVRRYFKVNQSERVEVQTTVDNLEEAKELMQEYPKTKFNFKMKYSSTYDLIGAVDSLNRKVYQAQYKCIVM
ncbi:hypothetical protein FGO68_gene13021 [Halteria grandinella]|uniref:Uncharacterized protein n=1 Tax=Halteria grandinella TaxID=5974 RepID=A0A8J8NSX7_HALGN|nr:hypothetical protein FGO68_gene13021 [Halteria grandinella]